MITALRGREEADKKSERQGRGEKKGTVSRKKRISMRGREAEALASQTLPLLAFMARTVDYF